MGIGAGIGGLPQQKESTPEAVELAVESKLQEALQPGGDISEFVTTKIEESNTGQDAAIESLTNQVESLDTDVGELETAVDELQETVDAAAVQNAYVKAIFSGTFISGGIIVPTGGVTFKVTAGTGFARDPGGEMVEVSWNEITGQSTTNDGENYISIDYNRQVVITSVAGGADNIRLGYIRTAQSNTVITGMTNVRLHGSDIFYNMNNWVRLAIGSLVEKGVNLSLQAAPNQLKVVLGSGTIWTQFYPLNVSDAYTFIKLFNSQEGYIPETTTAASTINTAYWNNVSAHAPSALVPMTAGYYKKDLFFATPEGQLFYLYGNAEYADIDDAKKAPEPQVPPQISSQIVRVASVVVQQGATEIVADGLTDIRPFVPRLFQNGVTATPLTVIDHGDLVGLDDDDHTIYLTDARGDIRYFRKSEITNMLLAYATLASPNFTGTATASTAAPGTNTTQLATTAFVHAVEQLLTSNYVAAVNAHIADADPHGDRAYADTQISTAITAHNAASDPHGDRAYASNLVSTAISTHNAASDPHGDRAAAVSAIGTAISTHNAATDPHGDRAYGDGQLATAMATINAILDTKASEAELTAAIAAVVGGAPEALNTLYEIASSLNNNASAYNALLLLIGQKVAIVDIIDTLVSVETAKPLSANQGRILKGMIDTINSAGYVNAAGALAAVGTVNGLVKGDGAGNIAAAVAGTDYTTPAGVNTQIGARALRYDAAQSLTTPEQTQARDNVGLGPLQTPTFGGLQVGVLAGYGKFSAGTLTTVATIPVADVSGAAPLASPTFSGTVSGPTPGANSNTTVFATTAFITNSAIRYDFGQTLTSGQKLQARQNLGLGNVADADTTTTANIGDTPTKRFFSDTERTRLANMADNANNYVHPAHSGDVVSVGDGNTTIQANVVGNTKLAQMATYTIKGRYSASTGNAEDVTMKYVYFMQCARTVAYTEDFHNGLNGTKYTSITSGTAGTSVAAATVVDTASHGVLQLQTGTNAAGYAGIVDCTVSGGSYYTAGGELVFLGKFQLTALSTALQTFNLRLGFGDSLTNADHTDSAGYLEYTHSVNSGNFVVATASNSVRTKTNTAVAAVSQSGAQWTYFKAVVNAAGTSVDFYINGSLVATHTTNIPSGTGRNFGVVAIIIKTVGTNNVLMNIDKIHHHKDFNTTEVSWSI